MANNEFIQHNKGFMFDPDNDCPAHRETKQIIKELKNNLEKEITDRRRVDENFMSELRKSVESVRKNVMEETDKKCSLIQSNIDVKLKLFKKEMDEFKQITKNANDSLKSTTRLFIVTSLTLWGTVIALIVHLAEKIPH